MRLTVLGCSGGGPTRSTPASGYLVTSGATSVLLDAGPGTFLELGRHLDPAALAAVVVSHIHVDHCADFFGLYGYLRSAARQGPLRVFVPEGAAEHLAAFAGAGEGHGFFSLFEFTTVGRGNATIRDVALEFGSAAHGVPALVTRLETHAGAVTYSGDTGTGGDLATLAQGADVLLCEAGLVPGDSYPHHLTAEGAGAVAATAGVGRLIVTHLPPTLDKESATAAAAAKFSGPVTAAEPGAVYAVAGDREPTRPGKAET